MRSGDLLNQLVNDIDTLDHLYLNCLSPILIVFLMILACTLLILHFSNTMGLALLVISLFSLIFITILSLKYENQVGRQIQQTQAILRTRIVDTLQGFVDLLLFETEEK